MNYSIVVCDAKGADYQMYTAPILRMQSSYYERKRSNGISDGE